MVDLETGTMGQLQFKEITADRILDVAGKQLMLSGQEVIKRVPSLQKATVKWLDQ